MFNETMSVTVNTVQRDHTPAWDKDYQAEIAKGSTSIRKTTITDGESLLRISHSALKTSRERHLEQMVETVVDAENVTRVRKVHIILEHDDTPAERSATIDLADGFVASLTTANLTNLANSSM
jgi:hypothetical protein